MSNIVSICLLFSAVLVGLVIRLVLCVQKRHCLLDASPDAVDQLRCARLYPIVIFVKHKSAKQIR